MSTNTNVGLDWIGSDRIGPDPFHQHQHHHPTIHPSVHSLDLGFLFVFCFHCLPASFVLVLLVLKVVSPIDFITAYHPILYLSTFFIYLSTFTYPPRRAFSLPTYLPNTPTPSIFVLFFFTTTSHSTSSSFPFPTQNLRISFGAFLFFS